MFIPKVELVLSLSTVFEDSNSGKSKIIVEYGYYVINKSPTTKIKKWKLPLISWEKTLKADGLFSNFFKTSIIDIKSTECCEAKWKQQNNNLHIWYDNR